MSFCLAILTSLAMARVVPGEVFPGRTWQTRTPAEVGLDATKLDALARLAGGRGMVVRHGYQVYSWGDVARSADVASAVKPVISTLLLIAIQEGRLKSVDDRLVDVLPELRTIDGGKSSEIRWRHLASQTSGYGLAEHPGEAYAYNDYALALYYDTLMDKVFREEGTQVLRTRLADPLGFEDACSFEALRDREGRLAISVRDFARFGLLILRHGHWHERQIVRPELIELMLSQPVPAALPRTSGRERPMLPGQRTLGGGRDITAVGPGFYSFNWWLNRQDAAGRRLYVDAPSDAFAALGHGGPRALWIIPSLDLVVSWNDARIEDHDASPGNPGTRLNQAARLLREAARPAAEDMTAHGSRTRVSIVDGRWRLNDRPTIPARRPRACC
jgi:CubicO group peptidase (beta-lactamase class C family)